MIERSAVLTLSAPLHHGSEKSRIKPETLPAGAKNNYTPHRRLPVLLKNGDISTITLIPAVSGNSIRHLWRESLVDVTLHTLGLKRKDLEKNILETFVSGGGMDASDAAKNDSEEEKQEKAKSKKNALKPSVPILVRDRETLRAAVPMLSLFGCSYGNRMLPGLVNVGWAIPALKQTEHITNVPSSLPYTEDLTSFQILTRHDPLRDEMDENQKSRQSIYYIEVVSPGVPFAHTYSINKFSTPIERSALQLAIDLFKENPYLGGKGSIGNGKVKTDQWYDDLDVSSNLYLEFLRENKDILVEYIHLWNKPEKLVQLKNGKEEIEFPSDLSQELDRLVKEREVTIQKEIQKQAERVTKK
ncbi:hypothetical protein NST17_20980 [Caldifermentibacillus hisashii]|uniref:Uncharacterized protein n=1 Tax=Caldifermentibacillus hisashii TaxID=996558 RepID=A0ABU9K3C7_9BACI